MKELILTKSEFVGRYEMEKCTHMKMCVLLNLLRSDIGPHSIN